MPYRSLSMLLTTGAVDMDVAGCPASTDGWRRHDPAAMNMPASPTKMKRELRTVCRECISAAPTDASGFTPRLYISAACRDHPRHDYGLVSVGPQPVDPDARRRGVRVLHRVAAGRLRVATGTEFRRCRRRDAGTVGAGGRRCDAGGPRCAGRVGQRDLRQQRRVPLARTWDDLLFRAADRVPRVTS